MTTVKEDLLELFSRCRLFNLSLFLIPLILTLTSFFEDKHALIYTPISWGIASFILFINFPDLLLSLHSRPIYYDDLIIKDYNDNESSDLYDSAFRGKYQKIFKWVVTITSTVMISLIVEIWYFRAEYFNSTSNGIITNVVALSIVASLFRIYYSASLFIGKMIMWVLRYYKQKEIDNQRQVAQVEVELALTNSGIRIISAGESRDNAPLLDRSVSCNAMQIVSLKPYVMADVFN